MRGRRVSDRRTFQEVLEDPVVQAGFRRWWRKHKRAERRAEEYADGRIAGARSSLYKVVAARSFKVSPKVKARIDGESDIARLMSWVEIAVNADVIGDVFAADASVARSRRRR